MNLKYGPYSPSKLETASCPYAFYRKYLDKDNPIVKTESLPQARGSVVHEVFELVTKAILNGKDPRDLVESARVWTAAAINRHPAAYEDLAAITAMVELYLRKPPPLLVNSAQLEMRMAIRPESGSFEECSYDDPAALARGRADIMMVSDDLTTALIYDHKTQPNIEEADTFQLGFYSWVILKTYPYLQTVKTILHFARYGYYSEAYVWTRDAIGNIEREVLDRIGIIESKTSWDAVPNRHCQYCPVLEECPVLRQTYDVVDGRLVPKRGALNLLGGSTAEAVKMAENITVMEECLKKWKSSLKKHVENYGPIAIHGKVYDFRASEEKVDADAVNKYHREHVFKVFEEFKIDPKHFMEFTSDSLKGLWKHSNKEILEKLSLPKKRTTQFRGYNS